MTVGNMKGRGPRLAAVGLGLAAFGVALLMGLAYSDEPGFQHGFQAAGCLWLWWAMFRKAER